MMMSGAPVNNTFVVNVYDPKKVVTGEGAKVNFMSRKAEETDPDVVAFENAVGTNEETNPDVIAFENAVGEDIITLPEDIEGDQIIEEFPEEDEEGDEEDDLFDFVEDDVVFGKTRAERLADAKAYLDAIEAKNAEEHAEDMLRRQAKLARIIEYASDDDEDDATTGTNYAEREQQAEEEAVVEEMEDEINGAGQPRDRRLKKANRILEKKLRRKSNHTTDDMANDEDVELARRAIGRSFRRNDPNVYCEDAEM